MDKDFNEIKERIEIGVKNNIPFAPRLVMLGEIMYAVGRGDITPGQGQELEQLLALREMLEDYDTIRELAFFGEFLDAA